MTRVTRDQRLVVQQNSPRVLSSFNQIAREVAEEFIASGGEVPLTLQRARRGHAGLARVYATIWTQSGRAAGRQVTDFLNIPFNDDARDFLRRSGAQRIRLTGGFTRRQIVNSIDVGRIAGLTPREIALGTGSRAKLLMQELGWEPIQEALGGKKGRARALTIARTETAMAHQRAAHRIYDQQGVTQVEWLDSPDCGVRNHDDEEKADGQIVTLGRARRYTLSHPNCVRASAPVVD